MTLERDTADFIARARKRLERANLDPHLREVGRVEEVGDGVAHVSGLPETRLDELLRFEDGTLGLAMRIGERELGCILLSEGAGIRAGGAVAGTGEIARVPVGSGLLGRVVSPIGAPLERMFHIEQSYGCCNIIDYFTDSYTTVQLLNG